MFEYDKVIKKLKNFDDLSGKKQQKIFTKIFIEEDYRNWFFKVNENDNSQPMTGPMVTALTELLIMPRILKKLIKFVESIDDIDHTAASLIYMVADQALITANRDGDKITAQYKSGEIDKNAIKDYREKSEKYHELIAKLVDNIKNQQKSDIKEIAKKSNLPKDIIYGTIFTVPGKKYIPKYKIGMYMNQLLRDIYTWVGKNGLETEGFSSIKWGPYFGYIFGEDLTTSAAISILLEGVVRIDAYRECEYFDDVRRVWDSLTEFALHELETAPENLRRQMLDLYLKRLGGISSGGKNPVRLRVDLLSLPKEFHNLIRSVSDKAPQLASLTGKVINNFRDNRENRDRDNRDRPYNNNNNDRYNKYNNNNERPTTKYNTEEEEKKPVKSSDDDDDDDGLDCLRDMNNEDDED